MTYRDVRLQDEALAKMLRDLLDRVERLEHGGAIAGIISLNTHIIIGGVHLVVTDTGGGGKRLRFSNPANGLFYDIDL